MLLPQDPVQAHIIQALNYFMYDDAILLCERLLAEVNSEEVFYLLATCYYRAGKVAHAYRFFYNKGCPPSPRCRYLYSKCCYDLDKLGQAENVLTEHVFKIKGQEMSSRMRKEYGDMACYALRLLGDIYRRTNRITLAKEAYQLSVYYNAFMFTSLLNHCQIVHEEKPTDPLATPEKLAYLKSPDIDPAETDIFTKYFQHSKQLHNAMSCVKSLLINPYPPENGTESPLPVINSNHLNMTNINTKHSSTPVYKQELVTPNICVTKPTDLSEQIRGMLSLDVSTDCSVNSTPGAPIRLQLSSVSGSPHDTSLKHFQPSVKSFLAEGSTELPTKPNPKFGIQSLEVPLYCDKTPTLNSTSQTAVITDCLQAPIKKEKISVTPITQSPNKLVFGQSSTSNTRNELLPATAPRRSKRILDNQNSSNVKENSKYMARIRYTERTTRAPRRKLKTKDIPSQQELNSKNKRLSQDFLQDDLNTNTLDPESLAYKQQQSAANFLSLLKNIAVGYKALSMYNCKEAIKRFNQLPEHQYNTGWVLVQVGRAYLELAEYEKAESVFIDLLKVEPHSIYGMDTYSTILYHLQKDCQLSKLSHELVDTAKLSPETWCVMGNCFSLQKEHETAIKFLNRAVQVDPQFVYAYSLLGHEYTTLDDYERAEQSFRKALDINARHYQSWYGLSLINYKREKFSHSGSNLKTAININPKSPVLICHQALQYQAEMQPGLAAQLLDIAEEMYPNNPLVLFHKASTCITPERYETVEKTLEKLKRIAPKESLVYFLLGKLHAKKGEMHLAQANFSIALSLDPKGSNNHNKEILERKFQFDAEFEETRVAPETSGGGDWSDEQEGQFMMLAPSLNSRHLMEESFEDVSDDDF